ncbi:MAG: NAD(P)/FAD-dependent oxidoreductase [Janthinobacterium lividum]
MTHVVIIGGGVIGSATAASLTAAGAQVTVLERDPSYAAASSSLSASSIRQQFSTPVNIALSQYGLEYIRRADVGLREPGYLYLAGPSGLPVLRENLVVQRAHGADIALLEPAALAQRFPWLALDGLAGGALGLSGEGWFDGPALAERFRRQARAQGAAYRHAEAVRFDRQGDRVSAVVLQDGTAVAADWVVNAAGPHARGVAGMAGIALPVEARKRSVFVFQCRTPIPDCPLVIDTSGVWFRPEGDRFLAGWSPPDDAEDLVLSVDHPQWDEVVWPALAARVPAFEQVRLGASWAGHYEYNTFDQNGLVGILPQAPNLVFANGFSGHGMQQSPGVGRAVAELILHGGYRSLDLSDLDIGRVAAGRQVLERNII